MEKQTKKEEDKDFEIRFYEGVLNRDPNFVEALSALGDVYTKKGEYEKGLEIDKKLIQIRPGDPIVFYNLACSYSLLQDNDNALDSMKQAISNGYDDFDHLEDDHDLQNLHNDDRFKKYFSKVLTEKEKIEKE